MRKFLLLVVILLLVFGGAYAYLRVTTPTTGAGLKFPLTSTQRALLLANIPAAADDFALIPSAAAMHAKLLANPVTREPVARWSEQQQLPSPWMVGGGDALVWRDGKRTSYAIRLDAFRAFLVRVWLMSSSDLDARWNGTVFVFNAGGNPERISAADLDAILALTNGLPAGDALAVQRNRSRGAFPPIPRPAVTSLAITPKELALTSRALRDEDDKTEPGHVAPALPRNAVLTEAFANPPRAIGDIDRLVGGKVADLVGDGGMIAVYEIDTGTFLPKPEGVIVLPADARRREALQRVEKLTSGLAETRDTGNELLLSFDRRSIDLYLKDTKAPVQWPANLWAVRVDPKRMVPVLEQLSDSGGFRLAAPRLYRSARDLRRWIGYLEQAETIEAAASVTGPYEELRARVASK